MGILSNERQRNKFVKLLQNHHQKLSILSYVVGLVWFFALAYQPLNAGTYFSENALLPGKFSSSSNMQKNMKMYCSGQAW